MKRLKIIEKIRPSKTGLICPVPLQRLVGPLFAPNSIILDIEFVDFSIFENNAVFEAMLASPLFLPMYSSPN
jgi:hypothetical protein